jgi:hypothetical protein
MHVSNNYKTGFQNVDPFPFSRIIKYKSEVLTFPEIFIACNVVFQCILGGVRSPMKPYDKQKYFCRLILETLSPIVYFNFISC